MNYPHNPSLRPLIPQGTIPRLLRVFLILATLLTVLFFVTTAEARFLFGNPPERMTWVMAHEPLPVHLVRVGPTRGKSMEPVIHEGDMLRVERYTGQSLFNGDVVALHTNSKNENVTHRVTAQSKTHILLAGDNNPKSDGWVAKGKILYIVRNVERASPLPRIISP